jgi:hypothetical protein
VGWSGDASVRCGDPASVRIPQERPSAARLTLRLRRVALPTPVVSLTAGVGDFCGEGTALPTPALHGCRVACGRSSPDRSRRQLSRTGSGPEGGANLLAAVIAAFVGAGSRTTEAAPRSRGVPRCARILGGWGTWGEGESQRRQRVREGSRGQGRARADGRTGPNVTPLRSAPVRVTLRPHTSPAVTRLTANVARVTFGPVALPLDGSAARSRRGPRDTNPVRTRASRQLVHAHGGQAAGETQQTHPLQRAVDISPAPIPDADGSSAVRPEPNRSAGRTGSSLPASESSAGFATACGPEPSCEGSPADCGLGAAKGDIDAFP